MLNDLVASLEGGKKKIEEEEKKLRKLREETKKRLALLKDERDRYLKKVEEKCELRVRDLEAEIEEIHKEIEKKEKKGVREARERTRGLRERVVRGPRAEEPPVREVRAGDYVMVRTLGSKGYVVELDKEGDTCEVQIGSIRTRVSRKHLEKVAVERKKPLRGSGVEVAAEPVKAPELNLIGMRVEEAMRELDKFMDRAILQGMPRVRILHGVGTGRLMSAVKEYLREMEYVKDLRTEERNAGGDRGGFVMRNDADQLLDKISILDVVSQYVKLRKAGKDYLGLCPFHKEKTPSFTVSVEKQIYYCFGCHEGGNAINFVMKYENLSFQEALESLGKQYGIKIERTGGGRKPRQYDAMLKLAEYYHQSLKGNPPCP